MKIMLDSSALAKRYVAEKGSEQVQSILQGASELGLCILIVPEIISALNRRLRENLLDERQYQRIKHQFLNDINDTSIVRLSTDVVQCSQQLLENHSLRAMDALHIAAALIWQAEIFITADKRQHSAASSEGLETIFVE